MPDQIALIFSLKFCCYWLAAAPFESFRQTVASAVASRIVARGTRDGGSGTVEGLYTILSSCNSGELSPMGKRPSNSTEERFAKDELKVSV
jgi:hypothetical protein